MRKIAVFSRVEGLNAANVQCFQELRVYFASRNIWLRVGGQQAVLWLRVGGCQLRLPGTGRLRLRV